MWTRGKDKEQPGKFAVEVRDWNGVIYAQAGGFDTHTEADREGERLEREMTRRMEMGKPIECGMTDDELIAALLA